MSHDRLHDTGSEGEAGSVPGGPAAPSLEEAKAEFLGHFECASSKSSGGVDMMNARHPTCKEYMAALECANRHIAAGLPLLDDELACSEYRFALSTLLNPYLLNGEAVTGRLAGIINGMPGWLREEKRRYGQLPLYNGDEK
ncbi:MAG: hypothetical protein FJY76_02450 [Candidatus Aenigmarchaeota archaeon]|nr:hypothetical protein [Candidatus Aenigmarchaeota archaeon]